MLVIRPEQTGVLKQARLRSFEHEMVAHLAEFSPRFSKRREKSRCARPSGSVSADPAATDSLCADRFGYSWK